MKDAAAPERSAARSCMSAVISAVGAAIGWAWLPARREIHGGQTFSRRAWASEADSSGVAECLGARAAAGHPRTNALSPAASDTAREVLVTDPIEQHEVPPADT
jgi:hypothetical protein